MLIDTSTNLLKSMGNQLGAQPYVFIVGFGCGVFTGLACFKFFKPSQKNELEKNDSKQNMIEDIANEDGHYKLALVVRNDLKMGKGKAAAQCSHAAVMAYKKAKKKTPLILKEWSDCGQPKIVLKVNSEKELLDLADEAENSKLLVSVVRDAGRTQVPSGSRTVLAIGPGLEDVINLVTGHLKLY